MMKIKEIVTTPLKEFASAGASASSGMASFIKPGAGTLFGGSFQQRDNPFRKPVKKTRNKK
jgi:hypothetical protein